MYHEKHSSQVKKPKHDCLTKNIFVYNWVTFITDCYCQYCRYILLIYMYAYILVMNNRWLCWCCCRFIFVVVVLAVSYDLATVVGALVFVVENVFLNVVVVFMLLLYEPVKNMTWKE